MTPLRKGCDVSSYQNPKLVNWDNFDFGIVRATFGTRPDKSTKSHVERIRDAHVACGLYHFFTVTEEPKDQVDAFVNVLLNCEIGFGDILSAIDVESYTGHELSPKDCGPLHELIALLNGAVMIYLNASDFARLGSPAWLLDYPLWVPNYPRDGATSPLAAPKTPGGRPWTIWQNLVGPLDQVLQAPKHPRAVDQNVARALPRIGMPAETPEVTEVPFVGLDDEYWEQFREARDLHIQSDG